MNFFAGVFWDCSLGQQHRPPGLVDKLLGVLYGRRYQNIRGIEATCDTL